jgi:hypothetical protein
MISLQQTTIIAMGAFLSSCVAAPARELSGGQQCALTAFPTNERVGAWSVDKFIGHYTHGPDALTVRRDGHRLLVEGWILGTRELTAESVESWAWHDGCAARYEFTLPSDGPGAWLRIAMPNGMVTDWHR